MEDLINRIEAAEGPDWGLDAEIACALKIGENLPDWAKNWGGEWRPSVYGDVILLHDDGSAGPNFAPLRYTSSIDAAMTLVPDGWAWIVGTHGEDDMAWACVTSPLDADENGGCKDYTAHAANPALALCAAALRARNG